MCKGHARSQAELNASSQAEKHWTVASSTGGGNWENMWWQLMWFVVWSYCLLMHVHCQVYLHQKILPLNWHLSVAIPLVNNINGRVLPPLSGQLRDFTMCSPCKYDCQISFCTLFTASSATAAASWYGQITDIPFCHDNSTVAWIPSYFM